MNIDTDLYAPILSGLEYFYPRMVPGGFLIVHDYGSLVWEGAEKAVDAFFCDKPECVIQIPDSCGSAVIRRLRQPGQGMNWIAKRQSLPQNVWHSAANGRLSSILTEGWSAPEPWGTWGVGKSHQIRLMVQTPPQNGIAVDIDLHAFVWDEVYGRRIFVLVNGELKKELWLTKAEHFTSVSLEPLRPADRTGALTIEFRPRTMAVPKDVMPSIDESRELGIALHRIRVRSLIDA